VAYRGLAAEVMNSALDRPDSIASSWHAEMFEVAASLLGRAQRSGVIITDAHVADVLKMVGAIAWAIEDTPDAATQAERLLALLMNGLHRDGAPR
jgi:hypothetical protein